MTVTILEEVSTIGKYRIWSHVERHTIQKEGTNSSFRCTEEEAKHLAVLLQYQPGVCNDKV
jgi:hypothetical protein